jgi:hypothetical protein
MKSGRGATTATEAAGGGGGGSSSGSGGGERMHPHRVCQVFCSAVPVSYAKSTKSADWHPLAQAFLNGAYEATLAVAALLARERGERVTVYLTLCGGGAFGNRSMWIVAALKRALLVHIRANIDVKLVHYRTIPKGTFVYLEKEMKTFILSIKKKDRAGAASPAQAAPVNGHAERESPKL